MFCTSASAYILSFNLNLQGAQGRPFDSTKRSVVYLEIYTDEFVKTLLIWIMKIYGRGSKKNIIMNRRGVVRENVNRKIFIGLKRTELRRGEPTLSIIKLIGYYDWMRGCCCNFLLFNEEVPVIKRISRSHSTSLKFAGAGFFSLKLFSN